MMIVSNTARDATDALPVFWSCSKWPGIEVAENESSRLMKEFLDLNGAVELYELRGRVGFVIAPIESLH